jgi:hypothetical protein
MLVYAMMESEAAAGAPFRDRYRLGLGGSGALLVNAGFWHFSLGGRYLYHFLGDERRYGTAVVGQAFNLGSRAQLRLFGEVSGRYREARLEAVAYF